MRDRQNIARRMREVNTSLLLSGVGRRRRTRRRRERREGKGKEGKRERGKGERGKGERGKEGDQ